MKHSGFGPKPVRAAAHWANIAAFGVVMLGLLILGELVVSQVIGIIRSPEQAPNGLGQVLDRLWPWGLSLIAVLGGGGLAIWSFVKHHRPRAWILAGIAYILPFAVLTFS